MATDARPSKPACVTQRITETRPASGRVRAARSMLRSSRVRAPPSVGLRRNHVKASCTSFMSLLETARGIMGVGKAAGGGGAAGSVELREVGRPAALGEGPFDAP